MCNLLTWSELCCVLYFIKLSIFISSETDGNRRKLLFRSVHRSAERATALEALGGSWNNMSPVHDITILVGVDGLLLLTAHTYLNLSVHQAWTRPSADRSQLDIDGLG